MLPDDFQRTLTQAAGLAGICRKADAALALGGGAQGFDGADVVNGSLVHVLHGSLILKDGAGQGGAVLVDGNAVGLRIVLDVDDGAVIEHDGHDGAGTADRSAVFILAVRLCRVLYDHAGELIAVIAVLEGILHGSGKLRAGEVIQPRLADCEQIKYLASRFVNTQSCFFIGRGFDYALSLEGSLKLKEISYVHSDAYAAGELKHGTISLITDGVPVIALATQKQVYEKTISNAKETKSRGARVILFTTKDVVVPEGVADYVVRLDDYDELLMPLQLIVPLQLFAYYMAVLRGCDVDKPRNLAKSVTVE